MSKEFLDDYARKLIEVHDEPGEVLFFFNSDTLKFKIDPRIESVEAKPTDDPTQCDIVTRYRGCVYGIGD